MWKIVFSKNQFEELKKFLFSTSPSENGCFLLANSYKTKKGRPVIIVTEVIKPNEYSWNSNGAHSLEPSSSFINQAVVMADVNNSSLIFVHTHPNTLHPSGFSPIDEESNDRLFENLSQIIGNPLGSLVFSKHGICGVVYNNGKIQPVSTIFISGNLISEFPGVGFNTKSFSHDAKFDRQIKAIGKRNQKTLQEMKITIVGAGGTGSALAVQLARMGVKQLILVDMDLVDETNIPRVYGSKESDIGKAKVKVLKKYIEKFSNTKVNAIQANITSDDIVSELVDSDVIFGCTDNLTSRSVLNDISIQYYVPLIDVGCRIHLNKDGSINQAIMKVQTITPDSACLWCSGTLDGRLIMQESLSGEEKKKLAKEGYYNEVEKQPSIISMTTMTASMAIHKLLGLLGTFGDQYSSLTQIEIKNGFTIDHNPEIKGDCICQKRRGKADSRRIVNSIVPTSVKKKIL